MTRSRPPWPRPERGATLAPGAQAELQVELKKIVLAAPFFWGLFASLEHRLLARPHRSPSVWPPSEACLKCRKGARRARCGAEPTVEQGRKGRVGLWQSSAATGAAPQHCARARTRPTTRPPTIHYTVLSKPPTTRKTNASPPREATAAPPVPRCRGTRRLTNTRTEKTA